MTLSLDLFWSFRSPYSYLATSRLVEMQRDYDLEIAVRLSQHRCNRVLERVSAAQRWNRN